MAELLSYAEIKSRFDGEWVLLENPETDSNLRILRGQVLYHSKSRDEVDRKALDLMPRHSAILYAGDVPRNVAVVL